MYRLRLFLAIIICLSPSTLSYGQLYFGAGAGYQMPFGTFEESNNSSMTYIIQLDNRYYCKFWYGLRIEYSEFEAKDNLAPQTPVYNDILNITPQIRYNFLSQNCYDDVVFPYLQAGLSFSSLGRSDSTSRFGIGALAGGGFCYGFSLLNSCMMLDANVSYNMPNIVIKDELRDNVQFLHLNLTLNVKL
ncbi:hypothetical protein MASR1M45_10920 [Candidatus Kapaibacterium sp.]